MCIPVTYEDRRTWEYSCWREYVIEEVSLSDTGGDFGKLIGEPYIKNDHTTYTKAMASVRSNR